MRESTMRDDEPEVEIPAVDDADDPESRDVLFGAYRDDELADEERRAFEARLEEDASLREAYEDYAHFVDEIADLPTRGPSGEFDVQVCERLRRRSGGRFFGEPTGYDTARRFDELAAVAMLAVMTSAYLVLGLSSDRGLESVEEPGLEVPADAPTRTAEPTGDDRR